MLPSSGNRSVSLWDVPDQETLQTWLDEFLDVDCSNEVFEVHPNLQTYAISVILSLWVLQLSVFAGTRGVCLWSFWAATAITRCWSGTHCSQRSPPVPLSKLAQIIWSAGIRKGSSNRHWGSAEKQANFWKCQAAGKPQIQQGVRALLHYAWTMLCKGYVCNAVGWSWPKVQGYRTYLNSFEGQSDLKSCSSLCRGSRCTVVMCWSSSCNHAECKGDSGACLQQGQRCS